MSLLTQRGLLLMTCGFGFPSQLLRRFSGRSQNHSSLLRILEDQMEKLLTDQRVVQALDRWLGMQRTDTEILYREAAFK